MTINKLNGTECGTEIAKKINDIIDEKASVSLDNLDTDGQAILDGKVNSSDLFDENEHIKINKLQSYSLPSNQYIDLTLGASGSKYTAPADGWYCISKKTNSANQMVNLISDTSSSIRIEIRSPNSDSNIYLYLPIRKGDKVVCNYSAGGATQFFRFIYAQGSAPQS